MTTRREIILALAASALAPPLSAAEQKKMARVGYLSIDAKFGDEHEKFKQALSELGWVEGRNIAFEYRWAGNQLERLPALAQELVALNVDLIIAWGTVPVQAAKNATKTIPIVMGRAADPVGTGLVASLARPGGNITGVSSMAPGLAGKRLELLREAIPGLTRVAFLAHGGDPAHTLFIKEAQEAAHGLGMQIQPFVVKVLEEIDGAFSAMVKARAGAVIVQPVLVTSAAQGPRIAKLAASRRLPTISDGYRFADVGGFLYYGHDRVGHDRRAAAYVDKILKGAKPADLPVEQPSKFELVINMKTAKTIGVSIPQNLVFRADRVIE